ncbi:hypothetical protein MKD34_13980 (plasmid) [Cetobacterium somerae]|nr:hypothetical protein [Cetobacterium somerae]UPO99035.1 hypothetical protein MKD34_13980 [Cetobacterium somerae]
MFFLEKLGERKKIETASDKFNNTHLSIFTKGLLKTAKDVLNLTDLLSNSGEDLSKLADIIIEYRNLIERDRNIEKMSAENIENFQQYFSEIEDSISQNLILKKRIEKTFEDVKNYMSEIIIPAIEKYGILKVVEAIKKTVSEFLPSYSPVFYFYANIYRLNIV